MTSHNKDLYARKIGELVVESEAYYKAEGRFIEVKSTLHIIQVRMLVFMLSFMIGILINPDILSFLVAALVVSFAIWSTATYISCIVNNEAKRFRMHAVECETKATEFRNLNPLL